jgi:hypothetical protein
LGRRERIRAAARKLVERQLAATADEAAEIGAGVQAVATEITGHVEPGALYWRAPFQFVCEQMAPRIARAHELPDEAADHVALYLLAALNEYVVALAGEFDRGHFVAWAAAEEARNGGGA